MNLNKKERLILINQYKILSIVEPEGEEHYKELISILENGFTIFYNQLEDWISDDMNIEEGKFVLDILSLYRLIEDLKRTDKNEMLHGHRLSIFRGFDGNNEGEYVSFTRFLILEQDKFVEQQDYLLKTDRFNSHMQMREIYARMLRKYQEQGSPWTLTFAQVMEIFESGTSLNY